MDVSEKSHRLKSKNTEQSTLNVLLIHSSFTVNMNLLMFTVES